MAITFKQPTYMNVPPGVYEGTLTAVEDIGIKDYGYGPKEQVKLVFRLVDAQGNTYVASKDATNTLGLGSTLLAAGTALLNGGVPKHSDDLVGKMCRVVIGMQPSKNGRVYSSIDSFLPSARNPQPAPPAPAPAAPATAPAASRPPRGYPINSEPRVPSETIPVSSKLTGTSTQVLDEPAEDEPADFDLPPGE
jgi:hypothetical protein